MHTILNDFPFRATKPIATIQSAPSSLRVSRNAGPAFALNALNVRG